MLNRKSESGTAGAATELGNGWLQVKIPLPFALKWVNSYIVPESSGVTIIDPGLHTPEALETWERVMREKRLDWSRIVRIVLTHQHPDHYGLAGYMQERSGAPVFMSRRAHAYAVRLWSEGSDYPAALHSLFTEHGMPEPLAADIGRNLATFVEKVSPQPRVSYIEAGERWTMGGVRWELIDAPGHAYGSLMFYCGENGWMVCGDQVLPHITPNVSVVPGEERDPLAAFLDSLEGLKRYEVSLALPGHRDPFADFRSRLDELLAHHARRLDAIRDRIAASPMTAFALCEAVFGSHLRSNPHNLRFAMAETLAHLFHLEARGMLTGLRSNGVIVYET